MVFSEKLLGMPLHDGQRRYLRQAAKNQYRIYVLTCANRWGKSVLVSILQLWYLFNKFGVDNSNPNVWERAEYRTANIAPHSALTEPVFKTIHAIMTSTFPIKKDGQLKTNDCIIGWFYLPDKTLNTPPYKQFFDNNSYIEHRSLGADQGDSLQGKPYGITTYDEGGRSDHLYDEIEDAIKPRLFDWGGPLHILSTPSKNSKSTLHFYKIYQNGLAGINQTLTQEGSLDENTFFTPEEIQAQKDMYADSPLYKQVIEGKFLFGGGALFHYKDILDAQTSTLNDGVPRIDGHRYIIGTDTAIGKDEMVHYVLDVTDKPYQLVHCEASTGNSKSPQRQMNDFINLVTSYYKDGNVRHILETWNGESVRFYKDLPPWIQSFTTCYGSWQPQSVIKLDYKTKTNPANAKKSDILIALAKTLASGEVKIPEIDPNRTDRADLTTQLQMYEEDDNKLQTDRVMALALAVYQAAQATPAPQKWQSIEM